MILTVADFQPGPAGQQQTDHFSGAGITPLASQNVQERLPPVVLPVGIGPVGQQQWRHRITYGGSIGGFDERRLAVAVLVIDVSPGLKQPVE